MSLDVSQRTVIYYSMLPFSCLSLTGCFIILTMYFTFTNLQTLPFKLITVLSLFDLINSVAFIIPTYQTYDSDPKCQIQAALLNFSSFGGLVWTTFMAVFLHQAIQNRNPVTEKTFRVCLIIISLISALNSAIPLFAVKNGAYGKTKGWCWIKDPISNLRYGLFFIPLFIIILTNLFIYVKVKKMIGRVFQGESSDLKSVKKLKNKLLFYPVIIIVCYLPYAIKAILELNKIDQHDFEFTIVSGILRNVHGLLNFLIYGLTSTVQKKIKNFFTTKFDDSLISMKKSIL